MNHPPVKLTRCPICRSGNIRKKLVGAVMCSVCRDCGQYFVNPRMGDEDVAHYYQGTYRDEVLPSDGHRMGDLSNQRERARVQRILAGPWIEKARTCLEIGCSLGYLMDQLNIWYEIECVGVEPDTRYHIKSPASQFKIYADIANVPPRRFDLIAMSHVLEHLNWPVEYLANLIENYAHDKTRFLVEVPNLEGLPNTLNAHHPFAFTDVTLPGLFARLGYKPLYFAKHGLGCDRPYYLLGVFGKA